MSLSVRHDAKLSFSYGVNEHEPLTEWCLRRWASPRPDFRGCAPTSSRVRRPTRSGHHELSELLALGGAARPAAHVHRPRPRPAPSHGEEVPPSATVVVGAHGR